MMNKMKYAALNLSIPAMLLLLVMVAGAFAQGTLGAVMSFGVCAGLVLAMRAAWGEICRMERLARQRKQAREIARDARRRRAAALACADERAERPALRVA